MPKKNIYLYEANEADRITLCGQVIKQNGAPVPSEPLNFQRLRVTFFESFEEAADMGIDQRLDVAVVHVPQSRGSTYDLKFLGVAGNYPLEIE